MRFRILALFGARVLFGQERANIDALIQLQSKGCEVLCVIRPEDWPELVELRSHLDARGLRWTTARYMDYPRPGWVRRVLMSIPGAYLQGNAELRKIIREFRPTHFHAFNPFYVACFYSTLKASRIPMVYRSGDSPTRHNAFYRSIWSFIKERAAHFVADSQFIKRELIATGVGEDKVTVLYAPPPARSSDPPVELPPASQAPGALRFVYIGQLTPGKGVGLAVEAIRIVRQAGWEAELVVAGRISDWSGDDWARDLRDQAMADPLIRQSVHFLGFVENVPDLLRQCSVHLAPSVRPEPYGLVVVEAKRSGIPSIVFASGGMPELMDDGVDGMITTAFTAEGLAAAMTTYLQTPGLAARHGMAALNSLDKLRLDKFADAWLSAYANVAIAGEL